ncbi:endonuclease III [Ehrlichia chaffeensis]|nr:iron-sulfur binding domain of endonuclease III family protein [Ehrlichia chaffeensis str. Jax]AHX08913.1 iron-sulfur binding domain of endonuclease III family protein [Ehrlichia chaffeensis str. Saint Vincent]
MNLLECDVKCITWLILHDRYVCKSRKPLCSQCVVQDLCEYESKSL